MSESDREAIMGFITSLIFCIGTSLWVFTDARNHYRALLKNEPDGDNRASGYAFGWFGMCAFFWIFCFPAYLIARSTSASDSDLQLLKAQRKGDPASIAFLFKTRKKPISVPADISTSESQSTMECPFCAELIKRNAKICRFCQRELRPQTWTPVRQCFECLSEISSDAKYCTHCGAPMVRTPRESRQQASLSSFLAVIGGLILLTTIVNWRYIEPFLKSGQTTAVSMHQASPETIAVPTSDGKLPSPPSETTRTVPRSAVEKTDSAAMKVVRSLYRGYSGISDDAAQNKYLEAYFDRGFLNLLQKDRRRESNTVIDWDPVWNTNGEHEGTAVSLQRERKLNGGQVSVEALLDRGADASCTVSYTLVRKPNGWRIVDINDDGMSIRKRLIEATQAPSSVPTKSAEHLSPSKLASCGGDVVATNTTANVDGANGEDDASAGKVDVDFRPYMNDLQRRIKKHWFPPKGNETKKVVVVFKIHSQGQLSDLRLQQSSGVEIADAAALKAVEDAAPFRNLPLGAAESVDIQFSFDYNVFTGRGTGGGRQF